MFHNYGAAAWKDRTTNVNVNGILPLLLSVGVDVTCSETDIQVKIDESVDGSGSGLGVLTLINSSESRCQATSDGSSINFDFTLGSCGTRIAISNDGDTAFYRNTITSSADDTQFEIICSYIRTPTFLGEGG